MALPLHAAAYYGEEELVRELGVSRRALRRSFPALIIGKRRVYRGADLLCATSVQPTASASTAAPARSIGGRDATLPAKEDANGDGPPASPSIPAQKSQREQLAEWQRTAPSVSPLRPRPRRSTPQQR